MAEARSASANGPYPRRTRRTLLQTSGRVRVRLTSLGWGGALLAAVLLLAIVGPFVVGDPEKIDLTAYLRPPSFAHPFGTDGTGRDLLTRVVNGARPSLLVSSAGMIGSVTVGVLIGMIGTFGGRTLDRVTRFAVDVQLAMPYVLVAIVLVTVAGSSIPVLILTMVLAGWVQVARVVRSIALRERSKDYVLAATAVGASRRRIATRYVFPSVLPAVLAIAPLQMAAMILIEATLAFLGMGIKPPHPSWGSIMFEGKDYVDTAWWLTVFPGVAIFVTALSLLLIADRLQRSHGRGLGELDELVAENTASAKAVGR